MRKNKATTGLSPLLNLHSLSPCIKSSPISGSDTPTLLISVPLATNPSQPLISYKNPTKGCSLVVYSRVKSVYLKKMDIMDSSSENNSSDSREESSQESKNEFSEDEESLIATMYRLIGERWALIAGRVPGRTAEEIEKYWTSRYSSSE